MHTHASDPLPTGKGSFFSRRIRRSIAAIVVVIPLAIAFPAHATNVSVTLDVYRGFPPAAVSVAHCTVSVPTGSSGLAVLQAADASGCIASFAATSKYGYGTYLECINNDCEIPRNDPATHGLVTYWRQSESGTSTCYGLDGFEAAQNAELGLAYTATGTLAADIVTGCKG